jgi:hypothetical protein
MVYDVIIDGVVHVLVLVETWHINSNDLPLRRAAPSGYSIVDGARPGYDINCVTNNGGIAVIYRTSYVVRIVDTRLFPSTFELLVCHLTAASSKLILVSVYRPSSHAITATFFEELTSLLELLATYNSSTIITGDFNIHVDEVTDALALQFLDLLEAFGLLQHVKSATHMGGHTLDLIATQPDCCPTHIDVNPPVLSDHGLVNCCFTLARPPPPAQHTKTIRRLSSVDIMAFTDAIQRSTACNDIAALAARSTTELCTLYKAELRGILDNMEPL